MLLVAAGAVWLMLGIGVDSSKLDVIRTGGTLGVGLGGVLVLWLGIRRQRSTELDLLAKYEAHELAERTAANTLAHQQQTANDVRADAAARRITELYTKAVEQLGSDKAPVRLGGLYALERLAQDNLSQRQTIVNVLCAYLRMPFEVPEPLADDTDTDTDQSERNRALLQEREVRLTAQRLLGDHLRPGQPDVYWGPLDLDLTGARLVAFDLTDASIGNSNFRHVTFTDDALFAKATFSGKARFGGADFSGEADFEEATFEDEVEFGRTTFSGPASFGKTLFREGGEFNEVTFRDDAWFSQAKFAELAWFNDATFADIAQFGDAVFVETAMFGAATFNKGAVFTRVVFDKAALFVKTRFCNAVRFTEAAFKGRARFDMATFNSEGGLEFIFDKAVFGDSVTFDKAKMRGESVHGLLDQAATE